jgi:hypothetical protein
VGIARNERSYFRGRAGLVVLWVVVCVLCAGCNERRESRYRSLADALKAGEVTRGWLPDWLPASSRAITLAYDPSSPRTWCTFEFSPDDSQRLRERLTPVEGLPQRVRHVENPGLSWWPQFLTGELDVAESQKRGFELYVVEEPGSTNTTFAVLFAVHWTKGLGFFHRTAGG